MQDIITEISGDSIEISSQIKNESIDFLFLDGTHGYEYCLKEIIAWGPKVKIGGIISGHDWPERCIKQAAREGLPQIMKNVSINVTSTNGAYWVIKC